MVTSCPCDWGILCAKGSNAGMSAVEDALRAAVMAAWRAAAVMAAWRAAGPASSGKVTLSIPVAVVDSVQPAVQLRL